MKIRKRSNEANQVLTGMIVNRQVLGAVAAKWSAELFNDPWSNLISKWCVQYYKKFKKAPGKNITNYFEQWADRKDHPKETVELMTKFLSHLSGNYHRLNKDINPEFVIDQAGELFTKIALRKLHGDMETHLDDGDIKKASAILNKFRPVEIGGGKLIDVLEDREEGRAAFESKRKPLITYPDALGSLFGDSLERDGFIAILGPEKRGKTWMLLDMAWRGMEQGKKILFLEIGDLSKYQIMRRFRVRASERPLKATKTEKPVRVPIAIGPCNSDDGMASVEHKERFWKEPLSWKYAQKKCDEIVKRYGGSLLKLGVYPTLSITATGIQSLIDQCERQKWIPDVVVIDYADILAPEPWINDKREQVYHAWAKMRAISQIYHCLVITATQASAKSYEKHVLTMSEFAEDHRKFAHVTGMFGLNQTEAEKDIELMRYNWLVLREEDFVTTRCVQVAGCRSIANPCMFSTF